MFGEQKTFKIYSGFTLKNFANKNPKGFQNLTGLKV